MLAPKNVERVGYGWDANGNPMDSPEVVTPVPGFNPRVLNGNEMSATAFVPYVPTQWTDGTNGNGTNTGFNGKLLLVSVRAKASPRYASLGR